MSPVRNPAEGHQAAKATFHRLYGTPTDIDKVWADRNAWQDAVQHQLTGVKPMNYEERKNMEMRAKFDMECG